MLSVSVSTRPLLFMPQSFCLNVVQSDDPFRLYLDRDPKVLHFDSHALCSAAATSRCSFVVANEQVPVPRHTSSLIIKSGRIGTGLDPPG